MAGKSIYVEKKSERIDPKTLCGLLVIELQISIILFRLKEWLAAQIHDLQTSVTDAQCII